MNLAYILDNLTTIGISKAFVHEDQKCIVFFHRVSDITEQKVGKFYLLELTEQYEELGYKVLHFYDTEIDTKSDILNKKIQHIFKLSDSTRIHARKCVIRNIKSQQKDIFLDKYHIQGTTVSKINLGAFYNDVLIGVMTFSNPRVMVNKSKVGNTTDWELVRFATNYNYRISGLASKMLNHFKNNYQWQTIYSYADRRWSTGTVYKNIGFQYKKSTLPEYYYIVGGKLKHRWGFRRHALEKMFPDSFNKNKTEYQNMIEFGYDRIWDCGSLLFEVNND